MSEPGVGLHKGRQSSWTDDTGRSADAAEARICSHLFQGGQPAQQKSGLVVPKLGRPREENRDKESVGITGSSKPGCDHPPNGDKFRGIVGKRVEAR